MKSAEFVLVVFVLLVLGAIGGLLVLSYLRSDDPKYKPTAAEVKKAAKKARREQESWNLD